MAFFDGQFWNNVMATSLKNGQPGTVSQLAFQENLSTAKEETQPKWLIPLLVVLGIALVIILVAFLIYALTREPKKKGKAPAAEFTDATYSISPLRRRASGSRPYIGTYAAAVATAGAGIAIARSKSPTTSPKHSTSSVQAEKESVSSTPSSAFAAKSEPSMYSSVSAESSRNVEPSIEQPPVAETPKLPSQQLPVIETEESHSEQPPVIETPKSPTEPPTEQPPEPPIAETSKPPNDQNFATNAAIASVAVATLPGPTVEVQTSSPPAEFFSPTEPTEPILETDVSSNTEHRDSFISVSDIHEAYRHPRPESTATSIEWEDVLTSTAPPPPSPLPDKQGDQPPSGVAVNTLPNDDAIEPVDWDAIRRNSGNSKFGYAYTSPRVKISPQKRWTSVPSPSPSMTEEDLDVVQKARSSLSSDVSDKK
jgi:hypothetical protein